MKAEIKSLTGIDYEDLNTLVPKHPECFAVALRLMAGPEGLEGEESFDFDVCSPMWLEERLKNEEPVLLRHIVLMKTFDHAKIQSFVERYVAECEGKDWNEVGQKLGRLGMWEFEDYREL
jgi:Immunity protein 8